MTWPSNSEELTLRQRRARGYAIAAFALGALSVALFFLTQGPTPTGWGAVVLLLILPVVFGATGIVCGVMSRQHVWVVLNSLVVVAFPLLMFIGSLIGFFVHAG